MPRLNAAMDGRFLKHPAEPAQNGGFKADGAIKPVAIEILGLTAIA
ncbi:MAG TPA: hypothetical protein VJR58_10150 [Vineibacter sp.]|nr:hypothetical protein [Vineibacter sp.]